jgi:hypothetical protein
MDLTRHASGQLPTRSRRGRGAHDVLIAGTVRRSSGWEPRAFARQVFERAARKHWGKCASFVTSALDLLKTNVCSHTVEVMVSYPSPTSRSGRRFGVWRGGRSDVVRALVRRLIARAMALGRPGLLGRTRELAEGVPRAGSSVPSKARRTLVGMNRTPHLERLAAPAKAVSRAGLARRLRARLARSPRARLAGSPGARLARACDPLHRTTAARDARNTPTRTALPARLPARNFHDARPDPRHALTNLTRRSPSSRRPRDTHPGMLTRTRTPTPTQKPKTHLSPSHPPLRIPNAWDQQNHPIHDPTSPASTSASARPGANQDQTSRARDALWRPCRHLHHRRGTPRQAPGDRAHHLHRRTARPERRARRDHEEFAAFEAEYRPLPRTRRSGLTMSSATSDT